MGLTNGKLVFEIDSETRTKKTYDLAIDGLLTDGAHHKQWYLERILELNFTGLELLKESLEERGCSWEPGIPP